MQTAIGRDQPLASSPTLSRLETGATRADAWALHQVLVEHFIANFATAPKELILDVDASDVPLHGDQELKQFHGYRSEEHTSELQSLMRTSYAVFCLKKQNK